MDTSERSSESAAPPVVVAGIDAGAGSAAVLRAAARLAVLASGEVAVAHVVPSALVMPEAFGPGEPISTSDIEVSLFPHVLEVLCEYPVAWRLVALTGDPATELARLALACSARAIVVGADTPGWAAHVRRLRNGAIPHRLCHLQGAPVVIIPEASSRTDAATASSPV